MTLGISDRDTGRRPKVVPGSLVSTVPAPPGGTRQDSGFDLSGPKSLLASANATVPPAFAQWQSIVHPESTMAPADLIPLLSDLSRAFPIAGAAMLEAQGFRIFFQDTAASIQPPPQTQRVGATYVEGVSQMLSQMPKVGGVTQPEFRSISVGGPWSDQHVLRLTDAVHELFHGLDYCLGTDGRYRSSQSDWQQDFENTTRFLTPYLGVDVHEFFVEVMTTMLLGHNCKKGVGRDGEPSYGVTTLAQLEAAHPKACERAREILDALVEGETETAQSTDPRDFVLRQMDDMPEDTSSWDAQTWCGYLERNLVLAALSSGDERSFELGECQALIETLRKPWGEDHQFLNHLEQCVADLRAS